MLVAGLWSHRGASFHLLSLLGGPLIRPVLSVPLVLEYEAVLRRRALELGLRSADVDTVLDFLCSVADKHAIYFLWRPTLKDPQDELVLEVAVVAECRYIVTHNIRDFAGSKQFGIEAITPGEFLRRLGVRT